MLVDLPLSVPRVVANVMRVGGNGRLLNGYVRHAKVGMRLQAEAGDGENNEED